VIDSARETDGPAILRITAGTGIFTSEELACVESIWREYVDEGETSGYVFLVFRDDYG
jgi:hypothetical protein